MSQIDFKKIRADFPALTQRIRGKPLVYLDSAATALKPWPVIERIGHFNTYETANVHRGAHYLADQATANYEGARSTVREFLNAESTEEIIFTKGTTEAINLVAATWAATNLKAGDEILLTEMEHHANIVPWMLLQKKIGFQIKWIGVDEVGNLDQKSYEDQLSSKTKMIGLVHVSNTLGTVNPVQAMIKKARSVGAKVLIDGAQAVANMKVDVRDLDADFYCFSGHKIFGPFGVGVLYGKKSLLQAMPPYQGGGSMISKVAFDRVTFQDLPFRFEAGTPNIEAVIALKPALEYAMKIGLDQIQDHEAMLARKAGEALASVEGIKILGQSPGRVPIFSFNVHGMHASDVGNILDQEGIAVRVGHLCTQPLLERYGLTSVLRASFSIYNNDNDLEKLLIGLNKARELLT